MKLSFTITKNSPGRWTLTLNRDDTGEQVYVLGGLRSEEEARHAAEGMRAAAHTAAVVCDEKRAAGPVGGRAGWPQARRPAD